VAKAVDVGAGEDGTGKYRALYLDVAQQGASEVYLGEVAGDEGDVLK